MGIPPVRDTDAEDVAWALQTADALWKRNERIDAIVWLRRAAQAAGEADDDERAVALARDAAELSELVASTAPDPSRAGPAPSDRPHVSAQVDALLRASGPDLGPPDEESQQEETLSRRLMLPNTVLAQAREARPAPAPAAQETLVDPSEEEEQRPSVLTADQVHAGMLDPWAELPAEAERIRRASAAPIPRIPPVDEDEVVTSARTIGAASAFPGDEPTTSPKPKIDSEPGPSVHRIPIPEAAVPSDRDAAPVSQFEVMSQRSAAAFQQEQAKAAPPPPKPPPPRPPPLPARPSSGKMPAVEAPSQPRQPVSSQPRQPVSSQPRQPVSSQPRPPLPSQPRPPMPSQPRQPAASQPRPPLPSQPRQAAARPPLPSQPRQPAPPPAPSQPRLDVTSSQRQPVSAPISVPISVQPAAASSRPLEPGVPDLSGVEVLADLPDDARVAFARSAKVTEIGREEEVSGFALAFVVSGEVDVSATMVDAPAVRYGAGTILRGRGSVADAIALRLICASDKASVATWKDDEVATAFRSCPWVEEDLRLAADRAQALAGVTVGPLGERLDRNLRDGVMSRLELRVLRTGDVVVEKGKPVPGLVIVGVGELELVDGEEVKQTLGSGEFLFAEAVLGAGPAPLTARAGKGGALAMSASRAVAQELLVTCPPLLELFAGM